VDDRTGQNPRPDPPLRTGELARRAGAHPNTVRLYQDRGLLPPVRRTPTGYRQFDAEHLTHLLLARTLLGGQWPGRAVRASAVDALRAAARQGLPAGADRLVEHRELVLEELARARRAGRTARDWMDTTTHRPRHHPPGAPHAAAAPGPHPPATRTDPRGLSPAAAAARLGLTRDTLRSWERSGLLDPGRDPATGARRFNPADLERLEVVRSLRQAGYSPMVVLRMLRAADAGHTGRALRILADPGSDAELITASDRWVAALADHERAAGHAVRLARSPVTAAGPTAGPTAR
jgi:DNA-binding transcriptional MerR regulator